MGAFDGYRIPHHGIIPKYVGPQKQDPPDTASGDWDAVRKVRDWLVAQSKKLRDSEQYDYPIAQRRADSYEQQADKLTAALPESKP